VGGGLSISVVIPCFNGAQFLSESLASVRRQTRPLVEVLVVDDGSMDGSPEIARAQGATVLPTFINSGPAAARNLGIEFARGDLIAFIDADDTWAPDHCATLAALLERHPEAALAFSRERRIGIWSGTHDRVLPDGEPVDAFWALLNKNIVPQMGVVVRREVLLAVGGYDERMRYAEDYDLWLRLARRYRFVASHALTCTHRGHEAQASRRAWRLARGAYEARWHALEDLRLGGAAPETVARAEAVVRGAWERYLGSVWRTRDLARFDAALDLAELVPGGEPIRRRWQRRARLLGPMVEGAGWVWEHMPDSVRASMRGLLVRG
jgi:glycosyltransferase involved in cell wall biosynthesis